MADVLNFKRDKETVEIANTRETAVRSATVRGLKPPRITTELTRDQIASVEAYRTNAGQGPPPRIYFVDPANYDSCYRIVRRVYKKVREQLVKEYRAALGDSVQAESDFLGTIDAIISAGFAAFDNPRAHPIKQGAGINAALKALQLKGRLLGINVDGKFALPETEDTPARAAVRAIAEAARELRTRLEQDGIRLSPGKALIDVGTTDDPKAN